MDKKKEVESILSCEVRKLIDVAVDDFDCLQEIRLRVGKPLVILYKNQEYFITEQGRKSFDVKEGVIVRLNWIKESMEYVSNYSFYAYEEEMSHGYITIQGGHRVGIAGKTIIEGDKVTRMRHVSFMNIRVSHEMKGCAKEMSHYVSDVNGVFSTLLISPPGCGKTTMLRDLIRILSKGENLTRGYTVGVVDERSELGACYMGVPQNDLGPRTDVLDCCPKAEGMMMLIRSMSPQILAVDEIGGSRDLEALKYAMNCGCSLIATVHGNSMEEIRKRPLIGTLVDMHMFQRYILLNGGVKIGKMKAVYDAMGNCLYGQLGNE